MKNTLKTTFLVTAAISAICLFHLPAEANSAVRRISVEAATGSTGTPLNLGISSGYGLNISFIPTGEIIEKVWLDDPSWLTTDVDGCLEGLSTNNCDKPGATVLHLRRIQQLNFPGLAQSPLKSTLLTLVTRGTQGRRVYVFRIQLNRPSRTPPQYHTVEVVQDTQQTTRTTAAVSLQRLNFVANSNSRVNNQTIERIEKGIALSVERQWLRQGSPLWYRLAYFLTNLRQGIPLEQARVSSQLSVQLVNRLHQLGSSVEPVLPSGNGLLATQEEVESLW
ncbi:MULTISPECIES: hypothetical protein [Aerosakkonema]|uniref:hypothetical protein n=1 Tax=Aerosakkonema TaxID=1246629 RepID=UPI0035BAFBD8